MTHPPIWEIWWKWNPCLENLTTKTHPYGRHIPVPTICYVPPGAVKKSEKGDKVKRKNTGPTYASSNISSTNFFCCHHPWAYFTLALSLINIVSAEGTRLADSGSCIEIRSDRAFSCLSNSNKSVKLSLINTLQKINQKSFFPLPLCEKCWNLYTTIVQ